MGATGVSTCANCEVGKYATFAGNPGATSAAACTACATSKTTVAAGSSQEADCLCQSGFTRAPSGDCVTCGAGKYKAGVGNGECDQCAAGKYLDATGSTAESACKNCPANSASPAASIAETSCTCVDGYTKEGSTCAQCAAGKYGDPAGSCAPCLRGKYSEVRGATSDATCLECAKGKYGDAAGRSDCLNCGTGTYSAAMGALECSSCQTGKFQAAAGQSSCQDCIANSVSPAASVDETACTCVDGYTKEGSTCAQCAAGKYGDPAGSCATCVRGKYSEARGATSEATCLDCDVGKYSDLSGATGVGACQDCPAATLSPAGSSSRDACVAGVLAQGGSQGVGGSVCTHMQEDEGGHVGVVSSLPPSFPFTHICMCVSCGKYE